MIKKKICLVGAFAVGKTSLVQQFVNSMFSEKYHTTVGVKVDKKSLVVNGHDMDLIIWDLHGEDDFQSVRMSYLRGTAGCFYVADRIREGTLDIAMALQNRVRQTIGQVPSILAINKCDLAAQWEADPAVRDWLNQQGMALINTSAKTGHGVETAFQKLAAMILEGQK